MNKVAKPNGLLHWHKLLYSLFFCLSFAILHPKIITLTEIAFQKVFISNTLKEVMKMLFFMTIASLTGLFTSGNWRDLEKEMGEYRTGRLSFVRLGINVGDSTSRGLDYFVIDMPLRQEEEF